ncbi:MAG: dTMP kinase [Candidatus Eiseniibacteriota bacterium]
MTKLSRPFAARSAGVLITFEGPDGSGKTTQLERLGERLRASGLPVELTREPKGTALGEAIFGLHGLRPEPLAELFLMLAQRAQHMAEKIRSWLDAGRVVLCDRFIDASVAYQGYGRGLGARLVQALNAHASGHIVPDLTLLLDVPPLVGLARIGDRRFDRFEGEDHEFHERVRQGYLALLLTEPRFQRIDAARAVDAVAADIADVVLGFLAAREPLPSAAVPPHEDLPAARAPHGASLP